jgi:formylmethanofuran dehydrogenase subunit D
MKIKVTLLTGRSLRQGVGKEAGKVSDRYRDSVAVCEMNVEDIKKLGVQPGGLVEVGTAVGSVVLKCVAGAQTLPESKIFIPYGPYASALFESDTQGSGMPTLKGVDATVEPAPNGRILTLKEMLTQLQSGT